VNETELTDTWVTLEPTPAQRRRIEARVRGWLEARESSLAAEWFALLRINPIAGLGLTGVAACVVLIAMPLSWVALSVL
jgi:hypothetical protein